MEPGLDILIVVDEEIVTADAFELVDEVALVGVAPGVVLVVANLPLPQDRREGEGDVREGRLQDVHGLSGDLGAGHQALRRVAPDEPDIGPEDRSLFAVPLVADLNHEPIQGQQGLFGVDVVALEQSLQLIDIHLDAHRAELLVWAEWVRKALFPAKKFIIIVVFCQLFKHLPLNILKKNNPMKGFCFFKLSMHVALSGIRPMSRLR